MVKKFDVVVFDLDSTLVTIEGLSWLAETIAQKQLPLLEASLDGKVALHQALQHELFLIAPSYTDLLLLGRTYRESLVDDAKEVIDSLHFLGKEVWLITNGFHPAIDVVGNLLGIPSHRIIGSEIIFDESGKYQGYDQSSPLVKNNGKAEIIKTTIHPDLRVAFVGDAAQDLETKPVVDLFIGYGGVVARSTVKEQAHVFITNPSMFAILPYLLERDEIELLQKHGSKPASSLTDSASLV